MAISSQPLRGETATVTYEDIARECGVGKTTVHRVLQDGGKVASKTRAAVLASATRLGYDPMSHQAARRMAYRRHGKTMINHMVALFMPVEFQQYPYYLEILRGVLDALVEHGYELIVCYERTSGPSPLPRSLASGEVDGAILASDVSPQEMWRAPGFASRPIVGVLSPYPNCSSVVADEWNAASLAVGHLLDLGHRHILHCYPEAHYSYYYEQRRSGYRSACMERGLNPSEVLIPWPREDRPTVNKWRLPWLTEILLETLKSHPEITAIAAGNDEEAVMIHSVLTRNGLRVPEDISLTGCDNVRAIPDDQGRNILTTVNLSLHDLGREAARMLVARIEQGTQCEPRVIIPASLVVRASTAPPRSGEVSSRPQ